MSREPVGVMALDEPAERAGDASTSGEPGRLLELSVVDLALIDRLRLELEPGLNVFTGETGAGKSLLIDALGLATGARADTTLVRHGAEAARVTALFDRLPEPLIAAREVSAAGRSTARLDDEPVTAARLGEVDGPARRDPRSARPAAAPRRAVAAGPPGRLRRPRVAPERDGDRRRPLAREPDPARHPRARSRAS